MTGSSSSDPVSPPGRGDDPRATSSCRNFIFSVCRGAAGTFSPGLSRGEGNAGACARDTETCSRCWRVRMAPSYDPRAAFSVNDAARGDTGSFGNVDAWYYARGSGACSMAAHIVLEREWREISAAEGRSSPAAEASATEAYLKINPPGTRCPALQARRGASRWRKNTAILPYLGKRFGFVAARSGSRKPKRCPLNRPSSAASACIPRHAHAWPVPESATQRPRRLPPTPDGNRAGKAFHGLFEQIRRQLAGRPNGSATNTPWSIPMVFVFYTWGGVRRAGIWPDGGAQALHGVPRIACSSVPRSNAFVEDEEGFKALSRAKACGAAAA